MNFNLKITNLRIFVPVLIAALFSISSNTTYSQSLDQEEVLKKELRLSIDALLEKTLSEINLDSFTKSVVLKYYPDLPLIFNTLRSELHRTAISMKQNDEKCYTHNDSGGSTVAYVDPKDLGSGIHLCPTATTEADKIQLLVLVHEFMHMNGVLSEEKAAMAETLVALTNKIKPGASAYYMEREYKNLRSVFQGLYHHYFNEAGFNEAKKLYKISVNPELVKEYNKLNELEDLVILHTNNNIVDPSLICQIRKRAKVPLHEEIIVNKHSQYFMVGMSYDLPHMAFSASTAEGLDINCRYTYPIPMTVEMFSEALRNNTFKVFK